MADLLHMSASPHIHSGKSSPLMKITSNYHYHVVEAESEEILDEIEQMLLCKGILIQ